jgi:pilus assembly protein CpaC
MWMRGVTQGACLRALRGFATAGAVPSVSKSWRGDRRGGERRWTSRIGVWVLATVFGACGALANGAGGGGIYQAGDGLSRIEVVAHKSVVIELAEPFSKVLVANDKIADVVPLTDQSISVVGKQVGATSLTLLGVNKGVMTAIDVNVTHNLRDLRAKLRAHLPNSDVRVAEANGRILLSGRVADARSVEKAVAIAEQYAPNSVTNTLDVRQTQQVMLEVRFVEASQRASTELGIGTRTRGSRVNSDTGPQALVDEGLLATTSLISGGAPFGTLIARLLDAGTQVDLIVNALEEKGLARRLAEPNLVTMSGVSASFLAGGEFPFPIDAGNDKVTVAFKTFGVALKFTPTVLSDGLINLQIEPEVSELDDTSGVRLQDVQIPGLIVRRAQTVVEVRDGQSFAIAGLLQHSNTRLGQQLPWIGRVPVLGALFRSAQYRKQETDLVIIITPRLVRPARPGERLATPLDLTKGSSEKEYFLKGRQESPVWRTSTKHARKHPPPEPSHGHILTLADRGAVQ